MLQDVVETPNKYTMLRPPTYFANSIVTMDCQKKSSMAGAGTLISIPPHVVAYLLMAKRARSLTLSVSPLLALSLFLSFALSLPFSPSTYMHCVYIYIQTCFFVLFMSMSLCVSLARARALPLSLSLSLSVPADFPPFLLLQHIFSCLCLLLVASSSCYHYRFLFFCVCFRFFFLFFCNYKARREETPSLSIQRIQWMTFFSYKYKSIS